MNEITGGITAPLGFKAGTAKCGIKTPGRPDLAIIASDVPSSCAGVFTKNRIKAAPVIISREHIKNGTARAIIVNSGNANACTGERGIGAAIKMAGETARLLKIDPHEVLVASTGVIGRDFPIRNVTQCLPETVANLSNSGSSEVAQAIMTTDTVPKEIAVEIDIDGIPVKIGAVAKGAGMICPDMATMLCFITSDANIQPPVLRKLLDIAVDTSFNSITVDGDMSTNDTVFILANGMAGNSEISDMSKNFDVFIEGLMYVCCVMAKAIVRDGEGATKFITIKITGASNKEDARKAGLAIANSSLVKTAFFGDDPNWGRIICAAGYSGVNIEEANITIALNDVVIFNHGRADSYNEAKLKKSISAHDIILEINLGMGKTETTIYTTDMSYEYVKINADYTT